MFEDRFEGAYWNSLGEYNYTFMPEGYDFDGVTLPGLILAEVTKEYGYPNEYHGKAVYDRASHHVNDKNYDINRCYLTAINLEKFKKDRRLQSESQNFALYGKGKDNIKDGHHMECFPYVKLVDHYAEWKASQRDIQEEWLEFLTNYDRPRNTSCYGTSDTCYVYSARRSKTQIGTIGVVWFKNNPKITIVRKGYENEEEQNSLAGLIPTYESMGYTCVPWKGEGGKAKPNGFCFEVDDQDTAYELFADFHR